MKKILAGALVLSCAGIWAVRAGCREPSPIGGVRAEVLSLLRVAQKCSRPLPPFGRLSEIPTLLHEGGQGGHVPSLRTSEIDR